MTHDIEKASDVSPAELMDMLASAAKELSPEQLDTAVGGDYVLSTQYDLKMLKK